MPEVNLGKVVGPKGSDGAQGPAGADGLSAYEQAQAGGYSGSELEFNQQLAGLSDGPFVPESDKGVASGVATLDSTGKVPSGQLPSMDYIPTSQKGAASGVASLDSSGQLEASQKPDYTADEVGAVPTTRTVNGKSLSSDVVLTGDDIKTSASDNTPIGDVVSVLGGATTPQGALANLGAGVRPNLLDNAIFIGGGSQQGGGQLPVNQRGQTSYTVVNAYGIDRWGSQGGAITVEQDSLKILFPEAFGTESLFQHVEKSTFPSGIYTISILTKDEGLTSTTFDYNEDSGTTDVQVIIKPGVILSFYARASWNFVNARIFTTQASVELSPIAFKLERGEGQTLAYQDDTGAWQLLPQPESDYATQLAKCQRYCFNPIDPNISGQKYIFQGIATTNNYFYGIMPLPTTMRINPTLENLQLGTLRATGMFSSGFSSSVAVLGLSVYNKMEHGLVMRARCDSANLVPGNAYIAYTTTPAESKIILSADL